MYNSWKIGLVTVIAIIAGAILFFGCNAQDAPVPTEETAFTLVETQPAESVPSEAPLPQIEKLVLPKLYLTGDISEMLDKSDERVIAFTYEDGTQTESGYLKIKIQGSSSLAYEKKNYSIKMYRDEECDNKLKIDVGWGKENKYCLKANWIDKTHARNIVTARIASQIQNKYNVLPDTPNHGLIDGFPIEVYNNDEFLGLYTWNIPKDEWQLNMDSDNPNHIAMCGEDYNPATLFYGNPDFISWELEVGEENDATFQKVYRLYDFISNSTDEEFKEHFHEYLNLDATLNYYLMADFAYLSDGWGKNILMVTYDSKVWYPSLYDMDTSWGTSWNGQSIYPYTMFEIPFFMNTLFRRIEDCFGEELAERYTQLRQDIFTKEHILAEFTAFIDSIPDETFEKEQLRWGPDIPGFGLEQIEEYLDTRIPALDTKYTDWNTWMSAREQRIEETKNFVESTGIELFIDLFN